MTQADQASAPTLGGGSMAFAIRESGKSSSQPSHPHVRLEVPVCLTAPAGPRYSPGQLWTLPRPQLPSSVFPRPLRGVCMCAFLGVVNAGTCAAGTRPPHGCTEPSRGCQPGGKPCYLKVISRSQPADESEGVAGVPRAPALPVTAGGSFSGQGSFTGHHSPGP